MSRKEELEELKKKMLADGALPLRKTANNLVFGEGDPEAEIMCIGEGPGYWEDQKGRPFVGNAGALLNQLLSSAGLKREEVFITNVVHFRPPENRDPLPNEIEAFGGYLNRIIGIVEPKIILTLGRFSMAKFLPGSKITSVHGKRHIVNWKGREVVVIPMFHPAAGLRSSDVKMKLFDDFKKLPEILRSIREQGKIESVEQMSLV